MAVPNPPRRRGAPLGNTNALKHGYYASKFKSRDVADLESYEFRGLADEIAVLRLCIRRIIELSKKSTGLPETIDLVRVLCLATSSLNRLVRTQTLFHEESSMQAALSEALAQVKKELRLDDTSDFIRPIDPH